jgi:hypothetical protein
MHLISSRVFILFFQMRHVLNYKTIVPFQTTFGIIQGEPKAPCTCRKYDVSWIRSQSTSNDGSDPPPGIWQWSPMPPEEFLYSSFQLQPSAAPILQSCTGTFDKSCTFKKNHDWLLPNSSSLMFKYNGLYTYDLQLSQLISLCVSPHV